MIEHSDHNSRRDAGAQRLVFHATTEIIKEELREKMNRIANSFSQLALWQFVLRLRPFPDGGASPRKMNSHPSWHRGSAEWTMRESRWPILNIHIVDP